MRSPETISDYLTALGHIVVSMAQLEWAMAWCILDFSTIQTVDEVACLVGSDQLTPLRERLTRIGQVTLKDEPGLSREFCKIMRRIHKIGLQRNEYIHSLWAFHDPLSENPVLRQYARRIRSAEELLKVNVVRLNDLKTLNVRIHDRMADLFLFTQTYKQRLREAVHRRVAEFEQRLKDEDDRLRTLGIPPYSN